MLQKKNQKLSKTISIAFCNIPVLLMFVLSVCVGFASPYEVPTTALSVIGTLSGASITFLLSILINEYKTEIIEKTNSYAANLHTIELIIIYFLFSIIAILLIMNPFNHNAFIGYLIVKAMAVLFARFGQMFKVTLQYAFGVA